MFKYRKLKNSVWRFFRAQRGLGGGPGEDWGRGPWGPSHFWAALLRFLPFLDRFGDTSKFMKIWPSAGRSRKAVAMGPCRAPGGPKLIFNENGIDLGFILGAILCPKRDTVFDVQNQYPQKVKNTNFLLKIEATNC